MTVAAGVLLIRDVVEAAARSDAELAVVIPVRDLRKVGAAEGRYCCKLNQWDHSR